MRVTKAVVWTSAIATVSGFASMDSSSPSCSRMNFEVAWWVSGWIPYPLVIAQLPDGCASRK